MDTVCWDLTYPCVYLLIKGSTGSTGSPPPVFMRLLRVEPFVFQKSEVLQVRRFQVDLDRT